MKEFRNPQDIHRPVGSYSHQIEIRGNERLLVISGQVGMREDGTVPDDPLEQRSACFDDAGAVFSPARCRDVWETD